MGPGDPVELTLDGSKPDPVTGAGFRATLCNDPSQCYLVNDLLFTSCAYEGDQLNTHVVEFSDGSVVDFHLRIDRETMSVMIEPAAYVRAVGTYAGVAFDQQDYFHLVYRPQVNHHFQRQFVVLFDQLIDGACGIEVGNLAPGVAVDAVDAYTVDCDLNRLQELTVSNVTVSAS